jgi:hypothetical protein
MPSLRVRRFIAAHAIRSDHDQSLSEFLLDVRRKGVGPEHGTLSGAAFTSLRNHHVKRAGPQY